MQRSLSYPPTHPNTHPPFTLYKDPISALQPIATPPASSHMHAHPPCLCLHTSSYICVPFTLLPHSWILPPPHNPPTSLSSPLHLLPPVSISTYTSFLSSPCPATSLPYPTSACRDALPCTYLRVTGTLGPPAHCAAPHFPHGFWHLRFMPQLGIYHGATRAHVPE